MAVRSKFESIVNYAVWAVRYSVINILAITAAMLGAGKQYKGAWLVAELPGEARDNGYWLYKFIANKHPEVNVYYAIDSKSPDYAKLPSKERVIEYGSFQHYLAHVLCIRSISSHIYGASPGRYFSRVFKHLMQKKIEVFLQHGISTKVINLRGYSGVTTYVADLEVERLMKSGHNNPDQLLRTGFARFDGLVDASGDTNILLIMPTFRSYLHNLAYTASDEEFFASTFYKEWSLLLNSVDFQNIVKKNNLEVVFYPHRQMQVFNRLWDFKGNITIGTPEKYDVQGLLLKSKIMITDYSSTYLDFMYMAKPAIVYQFDVEEVTGTHYKEVGVYPLAMSATTLGALIANLDDAIKNNYALPEHLNTELDDFYPFRDTRNSDRIYKAILDMKL